MALFNVPKRAGREQDKAIANKSKSSLKQSVTVKGNGLLSQISQIKAMVETHLGKFKDDYVIITEEYELHNYFVDCYRCFGYYFVDCWHYYLTVDFCYKPLNKRYWPTIKER